MRRALGLVQRNFTSSAARFDEAASPAGPKEFAAAWLKKAPSTMEVPQFPTNFLSSGASGENMVEGDLFPVNFYTPHGVLCKGIKKDTVVLPGVDGYFGLKANHVPVISQLQPGLVELHTGTEVEKYFISGGFAMVHPNGVTDICVLEAATLDQIDKVAVKAALAAAQAATPSDEYDVAANRAAIELYAALDQAAE